MDIRAFLNKKNVCVLVFANRCSGFQLSQSALDRGRSPQISNLIDEYEQRKQCLLEEAL